MHPHCTSRCIQRRHPVHQSLQSWPPTCCASPCSQSCARAVCAGGMGRIATHGVPVHPYDPPRSIQPCIPCSRPTCRRLASNVPGLWPWLRSPAGWLQTAQHRRAAAAQSDSEGQRRKARLKGAAPRCAPSQSARGFGAARAQRRLRAAHSPNALPALEISCAASASVRWAWLEPHHEPA